MSQSQHSIVHVDLPSVDPDRSGRFYAELFGWQIQPVPEFDYALFSPESGSGGGFPRIDGELYAPNNVLIYVDTENIEQSLASVEELGGSVVVPRTEIPGNGWFAVFSDLSGNRVALYSTNPPAN